MRPFPLSDQQQDLWLLAQLVPEQHRCALNLCYDIALRGPLDASAMAEAVRALGCAHPVLRTRLRVRGGFVWQSPAGSGLSLRVLDTSGRPRPSEAASAIAQEEADRAMSLDGGPLCSFTLVRTGDRAHRLIVNVHHIIADGASIHILRSQLAALYSQRVGSPNVEPPPAMPGYDVFVTAQATRRRTPLFARAEAYWSRQLDTAVPFLDLPFDFECPPRESFRGDGVTVTLDSALIEACRRTSFRLGVPFPSFLLTAFAIMLADQTSQERMVVGTSFAGRRATDPWRNAIGFFANTVPLVLDIDGASTQADLIRHVSAKYVAAYDHQEYPLRLMLARMSRVRAAGRRRLFQVVFNYQSDPPSDATWGGAAETAVERVHTRTSTFDFLLHVTSSAGGTVARFDYCADLFAADSIARIVAQYGRLLEAAVSRPPRASAQSL